MRNPPINTDDLVSLGMDPRSGVMCDGTGVTVTPPPSRLIAKLLSAAAASPPPYEDRLSYLRHVRDLLMGCTDWTQAADSPLSEEQRAAWATYRQALRDLTQTYSGDGPIPWPVAP